MGNTGGSTFNSFVGHVSQTQAINQEALGRVKSTWQSNDDRNHRIHTIHRLLEMLDLKLHQTIPRKQLTDIARLLELALYRRAYSLEEYLNPFTLEKRLEYLALVGYPPASRAIAEESPSHEISTIPWPTDSIDPSRKRKLPYLTLLDQAAIDRSVAVRRKFTKIQGESDTSNTSFIKTLSEKSYRYSIQQEVKYCCNGVNRSRFAELFQGYHQDVLSTIYGFIDGKETLWHQAINRFASTFLPGCVSSLYISSSGLEKLLQVVAGRTVCMLEKCSNLKQLVISNHFRSSTKLDYSRKMYDSRQRHQCYCCSPGNAESAIFDLAKIMAQKKLSHLESLEIHSVFFNSMRTNAAKAIAQSLASGACPHIIRLSLVGNGIGDDGIVELSSALGSEHCRNIVHLDFRMNYIGEKGASHLFGLCRSGKLLKLKQLCLGGNIITDIGARQLADAFLENQLPDMEFLGLGNNYLHGKGIAQIAQSLKNSATRLRQLSFEHNHLDNHGAAALALYMTTDAASLLCYIDAGVVSKQGARILSGLQQPNCAPLKTRYLVSNENHPLGA